MNDESKFSMSEADNLLKKNKRTSRISSVLGIIVMCIGTFFTIYYISIDQKIASKTKDPIMGKNKYINPNSAKIKNIVNQYVNCKNNHNLDSLFNYYSDTLERYYLQKNLPKENAIKYAKSYWKRHPNDHFYRIDTITNIQTMNGYFIVLFNGKHCIDSKNCRENILELRINKSFEIFYVRAYYAE